MAGKYGGLADGVVVAADDEDSVGADIVVVWLVFAAVDLASMVTPYQRKSSVSKSPISSEYVMADLFLLLLLRNALLLTSELVQFCSSTLVSSR